MRSEQTPSGGATQVKVEGEMTIYTVAQIKADIARAMQTSADIEVDLSGSTEVDTAGLQLMLMAKKCPGKKVVFTNHTPQILRLIGLANLGGALGDMLVLDAIPS